MVRKLITPLLAATVLALAACGGDDTEAKNDYVAAVNRAQTTFQEKFAEVEKGITATSTPKQDQATLTQFRTAVDDVVADLKAIDPPDDVEQLHQRLVTRVGDYGAEIDKAKKAFASDDPQEIIKANTDFATAVTKTSAEITSVIDEINQKLQS